jgi:hypothetical protein
MQLIIGIQTVELAGQHWIRVDMDGREMRRLGPYPDADAAETMAKELSTAVQETATATPRYRNTRTTDFKDDHELIQDCCRFSEGILDEAAVKKRYGYTDATWEKLGNDEKFLEAVEIERIRRTRNGSCARERAQKLFTETPTVLGSILNSDTISARHKIEAAREIRTVAATGPDAVPTSEKFSIVINLGEDTKLRFDKSIAPGVDDDGRVIDGSRLITNERRDD